MYKLKGHGLELGQWFLPESQSMTLTERGSTSSITLGPDGPEIGFDDWLLDDEWKEGRIIWRVKSIDDQTDTGTRTINLEHVIRTLEDIQIFDAIETSDISGGDYATCKQAIEYLLARQSDWVLGTIKESISQPYEFSGGESVYDAIESVCDTMEDAEWWYDLSVYPFRLNIQKRSETVYSEMRGGRNVSTLRRSVNRSGMYTRIWPVGENDLHISGSYLSKNEKIYGRVDKVETNQSRTSEASLKAWAQGLLNKHCEPVVTITISGLDLAEETGESLDWIRLNRVCRCPLPEYKTTILERVIKIAWKDRIADPESITVTLGNNTADATELTKTISESTKSSGKGARGQAKQNYLFEANGEHLLYEVFDECGHLHGVLRVTSESLRTAFENLNECTRSEMILTSESLRVHFENEISSTRSQLEMTSESLRVQFENEISSTRSEMEITSESLRVHFENEISSTRSEFQMTAESLRTTFENEINSTRSEFQITSESLRTHFENEINSTRSDFQITSESLRTYFENLNNSTRSEFQITSESLRTSFERELDSAWSAIDANADSISLKVGKGDVATQLAVECGNVSITGGNLTVDGLVTASAVEAAIGGIDNLSVHSIRGDGFIVTSGVINGGGDLQYKGESLGNFIASVDIKDNTLTLIKGDGTVAATFSKATTLSADWGSGDSANKLTVTAKQTNDGKETDVASTSVSITLTASGWSNGKNTVTAKHGSHEIASRELDLGDPSWADPIWNTAKTLVTRTVTIRGREFQTIIDTTEAVSAGKTAGQTEAGLTLDTSAKKVKRALSSTVKEYSISASGGMTYSTDTHKYLSTHGAKVGSTLVDSFTTTSGTEAYDAGYSAGWKAACAKISRTGNVIYGPSASDVGGNAVKKYTANYTASSHSYTASKYSASDYTKEKHSYTASSHTSGYVAFAPSGTRYTSKQSGTAIPSGTTKFNFSPGEYSASSHSYAASSYSASSYTAESHSYTASSFSWTNH